MMFYIKSTMRFLLTILIILPLLLPGLAGAAQLTSQHPDDIRRELERLKVFYTDQHPDVQRLKRHLQRALELQKQKKAGRAGGQAVQPEPQAAGQKAQGNNQTSATVPKEPSATSP